MRLALLWLTSAAAFVTTRTRGASGLARLDAFGGNKPPTPDKEKPKDAWEAARRRGHTVGETRGGHKKHRAARHATRANSPANRRKTKNFVGLHGGRVRPGVPLPVGGGRGGVGEDDDRARAPHRDHRRDHRVRARQCGRLRSRGVQKAATSRHGRRDEGFDVGTRPSPPAALQGEGIYPEKGQR